MLECSIMKHVKYLFVFLLPVFLAGCILKKSQSRPAPSTALIKVGKPEFVRGIHLTPWIAGEQKYIDRFDNLFGRDKLNTVVIAVKECAGDVYIPGVGVAHNYGINAIHIKQLGKNIRYFKSKGVYTIARVVVFKDKALAVKMPGLAVKTPSGATWHDRRGNCWTDPYNREVWKYNVEIAKKAVDLGFEEIQFDYVRFPSDGDIRTCRYSQNHSTSSSAAALADFLLYAKREIPAPISVDVFGLTPSVETGMGIGQRFLQMADAVDYISPMVYPSHYGKNEYGIKDPNSEPYKIVYKTLSDANKLLKNDFRKLRPYLQDFSLGYKYGPEEVKAQIKACYDNGVYEWLLWDPRCKYTLEAIEAMSGYKPPKRTVESSTTQAKNIN